MRTSSSISRAVWLAILAMALYACKPAAGNDISIFDGERALRDVETQLAFGPRTPGSQAHEDFRAWLQAELESAGWQVDVQLASARNGTPLYNLTASRSTATPDVILGAHYDSRLLADQDQDPDRRTDAVPGGNDGASGVAVLLELARVLPADGPVIWLVFFDGEDQGNIPGWKEWIQGSTAFAANLTAIPRAVVIVDMIGDADLAIYQEASSDRGLTTEIWASAAELGYADTFIPEVGYALIDDHTPFLQRGIPAVDIIDFHYPPWHTTLDTADKVSSRSLQIIGETLLHWLAGFDAAD